jgi:hypothetical protein
MTTTYTFHTDPGHGWLEVPMTDIDRLGLASKISRYSYRKGETAYLEEDCDASLFVEAIKASGSEFKYSEQTTNADSFIRALPRF